MRCKPHYSLNKLWSTAIKLFSIRFRYHITHRASSFLLCHTCILFRPYSVSYWNRNWSCSCWNLSTCCERKVWNRVNSPGCPDWNSRNGWPHGHGLHHERLLFGGSSTQRWFQTRQAPRKLPFIFAASQFLGSRSFFKGSYQHESYTLPRWNNVWQSGKN